MGLFQKRGGELTMDSTMINGEPALLLRTLDGDLDTVVLFSIENYQISHLFLIRNPDKLGKDSS